MGKYVITIIDNKDLTLGILGDDNNEPFASEFDAYNFLVEKNKIGDIIFEEEEIKVPHGFYVEYFIRPQGHLKNYGDRLRIYIEEIKKFRKI